MSAEARTIPVVSAWGQGATPISAFDDALFWCGVSDRNLLTLSSVVPPGWAVVRDPMYKACPGQWGDRLYVVMARAESAQVGMCIGAGIAWAIVPGGQGGLFVEHHMVAAQEAVELVLPTTLRESMEEMLHRRGIDPAHCEMGAELRVGIVTDKPACVLVMAVYDAEPWRPV